MNLTKLLTPLLTMAFLAVATAPAPAQHLPRLLERVHDALHDHVQQRRHTHCDACRRWIPPRCETVTERVWVPGRCERIWVPPVYRDICDPWGRHQRVLASAGYWRTIQHPGHYEGRTRQVTVPGRWEYVCGY